MRDIFLLNTSNNHIDAAITLYITSKCTARMKSRALLEHGELQKPVCQLAEVTSPGSGYSDFFASPFRSRFRIVSMGPLPSKALGFLNEPPMRSQSVKYWP